MSQMREEFEAWVVTQGSSIMRCGTIHDPSPVYMYVETQAMWLAWKASRTALVVELPERDEEPTPGEGWARDTAIEECADAIRAAGVKVKP